MKQQWRQRLSILLLVATLILTILAGPTLYVSSVIDDEDAFVSVADQIFAHPAVRTVVAESATTLTIEALEADEVLAEALPEQVRTFAVPLTRIATTQLTDAAFKLLDTEIAVEVRDTALREVHSQITAESDEVVLDLRAVMVRTSREIGGPTIGAGVAKFVSGSDKGRFTLAKAGSSTAIMISAVRLVPAIGTLVALAAVLSLIGAILVAPDRRRALVRGGLALAAGAAISTVLISVLLFVILGIAAGGSPAGTAVAEVISGDFAQQQRGVLINGIILALIGVILGNRPSAIALRSLPANLWHRREGTAQTLATVVGDNPPLSRAAVWLAGLFTVTVWSRPTTRVLLTIAAFTLLGQLGVWLATATSTNSANWRQRMGLDLDLRSQPDDPTAIHRASRLRMNLALLTLLLLVFVPGWNKTLVVVVISFGALVQALIDIPQARSVARSNRAPETAPEKQGVGGRYLIAGAVAAIAAVFGFLSTAGSTDRAEAATGCNGHIELCDKTVDEVVFAGSHNSMSSTDLGWELALQTGDIVTQLDTGIRALLIDALYWEKSGEIEGGENAAASSIIEAALSEDEPKPGTWLCHGFCALGATDLTGGLTDIALWLESNPREVLLIVVQDEISPADLTTAFETSGLRDLAFVHQPGTPFPTLGELIDSDRRVLIYGENNGESNTWFQNAWASDFTETPYTFALRSEFSCAPNRGEADGSLFLINHWLTTGIPVREAASVVNGHDALLDRVEACRSERGRLPTILATDFVQTGDLIQVVNELNGVAGSG